MNAKRRFNPSEDSQLQNWLQNFLDVCQEHREDLKLSVAEVNLLTQQVEGFSTGMVDLKLSKMITKGAVTFKNTKKAIVTSDIRLLSRKLKADNQISPALLTQLGLVAKNPRGPVVKVSSLTAKGEDNGANKLKWNRNGNGPTTMFIVEYRTTGQTDWAIAGAVTRTNFVHENQIPGREIFYRVTSSRGGQTSIPTAPVVVYGDSNKINLKAAA